MVAIPCPAPMHMVARAKLRLRSCHGVNQRRGDARAAARRADGRSRKAPPRTLTFSGSASSSLITASAWAANASLISIRSMSLQLEPRAFQGLVRRRAPGRCP